VLQRGRVEPARRGTRALSLMVQRLMLAEGAKGDKMPCGSWNTILDQGRLVGNRGASYLR
jgi:hypothetical protein